MTQWLKAVKKFFISFYVQRKSTRKIEVCLCQGRRILRALRKPSPFSIWVHLEFLFIKVMIRIGDKKVPSQSRRSLPCFTDPIL